ncbi:hypothetical protein EBZ38_11105 [bacterium]|nr:hypothetical protein [bacterium]
MKLESSSKVCYVNVITRNNDTFTHVIGPFSVRPGETLSHYWTQVATIEGDCTILLNDRVLIIITS